MRFLLLSVLLLASCILPQAEAQEVSPFQGVWAGKTRVMLIKSGINELEISVDGSNVQGSWQDITNAHSCLFHGSVLPGGKEIRARFVPPCDNVMTLTLLKSGTLKVKGIAFSGTFQRANQLTVNLPQYQARDNSDLVLINQMAADLNQQAIAMRNGGGASSTAIRMPANVSSSSGSCGAYPLEARGEHPPGRVCRCTISASSNQPGWWAVVPGNESAGVVACGPPRDGNDAVAYTSHDEDRTHQMKVAAWNAEQQRQRDIQAAADRERAMQQQIAEQQRQIAQLQQQQRQQQQQRSQQGQGQYPQTGSSSGQSGSGLPTYSPNQCFSDRTSVEGDVSVIYLTNRCSHRVYWNVCVNKANAPWNDHYPGYTDPGGQSSIRMWQPGEKTSATYQYRTSFDGSQSQPSC